MTSKHFFDIEFFAVRSHMATSESRFSIPISSLEPKDFSFFSIEDKFVNFTLDKMWENEKTTKCWCYGL